MSEGKLPKGWKELPLIDLLEVLETGSRPKGGVQGILNGIPSLGGEHLDYNGNFKFDKLKYIPHEFAEKMKRGKIQEEDVLIVKDGATTGKTSYVSNDFPFENAYVNEHVFICRPTKLNSGKFISYFLRSREGQIRVLENFTGSAQGGINQKFAKNTIIPIPSLPEQQRIVARLDAIFGHLDVLKEKLDRIPELLKNFRQQVLTKAVTGELTKEWREGKGLGEWEETTFGEVMEGTPKNGAYFPKDLYGAGIRIIRIDAFYDGVLTDWTKLQRVNISKKDLEQYNIQVGDILVNRVNSMEYLGKCMLVDKLPEPCIYESNMMRVRLQREKITPEYTRVFLTSPIGLKELRKNAKQAVNQASINQKDVMQVQISIPSQKEQKEIVNRVDKLFGLVDKIESQYLSLKTRIDQFPQAVLAKAFRGELIDTNE